ncbi:hypothetical protein [Gillisia sp. Hel_I_29]|uniref:hypothetical protein n=1 Tax=Gillisia sp. Hel_I_29 TaxID=1249975 RepID=UPI00054DD6C3|nr:hypothetical protein [Gillisia sp. Hel_I_29]
MKFSVIVLFFSLLLSFPSKAQVSINNDTITQISNSDTLISTVPFNSNKIEEFKNSKDFAYLNNAESDGWWARFKNWLRLKYNQFVTWFFEQFGTSTAVSLLLKILPYFLLGILVLLIGWLFSKLSASTSMLHKNKDTAFYINAEEEIIRSKNIDELISSAIQAQDYRLAIRYYYLQLLKIFNSEGTINYEFQKTNDDYLAEIKNLELKASFKNIIRLYDFIWYGNFNIGEKEFQRAQESFKGIKNDLNSLKDE